MSNLSPAAQAVLDAAHREYCDEVERVVAAALRAAVGQFKDRIYQGTPSTDWGKGWKAGALDVADGFLAIAAELENAS